MSKKILKSELMFHGAHGLCRVTELTKKTATTSATCSLRSMSQSRSKARFTVPVDMLEAAGFNKLVSAKEAAAILDYFKTGDKKEFKQGHAWTVAIMLREESCSKVPMKDKLKARKLGVLVRSLVSELAIALQLTFDETIFKIKENLETVSKINPLILASLIHVSAI